MSEFKLFIYLSYIQDAMNILLLTWIYSEEFFLVLAVSSERIRATDVALLCKLRQLMTKSQFD